MINPRGCTILLTLSCSLRCKMCHLWENNEKTIIRPSVEQWKSLIDSLSRYSRDGFNVVFGGGEPLMRPDELIELISYSNRKGLRTSLATSGYFIDRDMAKRLISSNLDYIALTLYSLKAATHNFLRGLPDSHEKVMKAIDYLNTGDKSLEIAVDTVIMAPNIDELVEFARWVRDNRIIRSIFFQAVMQPFHTPASQEWFRSAEYDFLWPKDEAAVNRAINGLIGLKSEMSASGGRDKINNAVSQLELFKSYFHNPQKFVKRAACNAIHGNAFTVGPDGSVNLCPYLKPIGNIKEKSIEKIWNSREYSDRQEEMRICQKNCHHIVNCWYEEEAV